jgi:hypothetical protein
MEDRSKEVIEQEKRIAARASRDRKRVLATMKPAPAPKSKLQTALDEAREGPKKLPWEK